MTPATPDDRAWIEATLRARIETSMFPLSKLSQDGMNSDEPRAMRFWIDRGRQAVLGLSGEGMLMPQVPDSDFGAAKTTLQGCVVKSALGEASQVRALLDALGLANRPATINEDEPQFLLDLATLRVPEGPGQLVTLAGQDLDLARRWRAAYLEELGMEHGKAATALAAREIETHAASDSHRLLVGDDGHPLAMTGFNARLPEIVQIGGVYTPPELRGRGHARRAVALHLADAARHGVERATLFAHGPAAIRTYETLGFRRIGAFALVFFREPERIGA